jgi:hypothetical protein
MRKNFIYDLVVINKNEDFRNEINPDLLREFSKE